MDDAKPVETQPTGEDKSFWRDPPAWLDFWADGFFIVLSILSIYIWQQYVTPRLTDFGSQLRNQKQVNAGVRETLTRICVHTGADRVILGQFHNGNYWASGMPWMQLSVTHEIVDTGVSKVESKVQGIHIETLSSEIEKLLKQEYLVIDKDGEGVEYGCAQHLESIGVQRVFEILVQDSSNKPIGIVSIQFTKNHQPTKFEDIDRREVSNLVSLIGSQLCQNRSSKSNPFRTILNVFSNKD